MGNIKGKTKKVKGMPPGISMVYTFSNEDLDMCAEVTLTKNYVKEMKERFKEIKDLYEEVGLTFKDMLLSSAIFKKDLKFSFKKDFNTEQISLPEGEDSDKLLKLGKKSILKCWKQLLTNFLK